ncbi:MAG: AsmA family protein, partial [Pseudomonadota bacterium]
MGRFLKFVFFGAIGLVLLLGAVIVIAALVIDPNDYRDDIAAAVREQTGRELTIAGDIELGLFPWLSLDIGETTLSNRPGYGDEPMLRINEASVGLRLLSLLSGTLEVGEIRLDGAAIRLRVNEDGSNNWDDIAEASAEAAAEEERRAEQDSGAEISAEADLKLRVAGVSITAASLVYDDREAGTRFTLEEARLVTGDLGGADTTDLDGGFRFTIEPDGASGTVSFDTAITLADGAVALSDVAVEADIAADAATTLPLRLSAERLDLGADDTFSTEALTLALADMTVRLTLDGRLADAGVTGTGRFETETFSPKALAGQLGAEAIVTSEPDALTAVAASGDIALAPERIDVTNLNLKLDATTFTGTLGIATGDVSAYEFELAGDSLIVDNYLAPADEGAAAAPAASAEATPLPTELIDTLNANGTLTLSRATLGGMMFENIELGLTAGERQIRLHPLSAELFGGSYAGDIRLSTRGERPALAVDERVQNVQLGPLAESMFDTENLSGTLAGRFTLNGRGEDLAAIRETLAGDVAFALSDGALEGRDLWYRIRQARALFRQEPAPPAPDNPRTEFSDVSGTGKVANGVLTNDDFSAALPFLQLTGNGTVDIAAGNVDYRMRARVLERPEFLEGASAAELDEYTEAVIPLKIEGPLTDPSIVPDIGGLVREQLKQEID